MNGDEAVFDSMGSALRFAFGFNLQQYGESPLAEMQQRGRLGSGKGLICFRGHRDPGAFAIESRNFAGKFRAPKYFADFGTESHHSLALAHSRING
jgi:hypothetical protein